MHKNHTGVGVAVVGGRGPSPVQGDAPELSLVSEVRRCPGPGVSMGSPLCATAGQALFTDYPDGFLT